MRSIAAAAFGALALLAGCAGQEGDPLAPRLVLEYHSLQEARHVALLADEHCDAVNGGDAWLLHSDPEPGGYRAAFVCR